MKRFIIIVVGVMLIILLARCKKQQEWLDVSRNRDESTLQSLKELQALLDNTIFMNSNFSNIGLLGADHYYLTQQNFDFTAPTERNAYTWSRDIFENRPSMDYSNGYSRIGYANIVLDALKELQVNPNQQAEFNNIKGQALFFRAMTFFELASVFCKQYDAQTAANNLGLSLKLTSDVFEIKQRSTIEETYDQIISDLSEAIELLSVTPKYKTRPSKQAVFALLARIYLTMGSYAKAKEFCDSVFAYDTELIDFNNGPSLALEYRFPDFRTGNKEIIFYAEGIGYTGIIPDYNFSNGFVDTMLFKSYEESDLRRKYFYEVQGLDQIRFRGTYTGASYNFAGLALNEVYLIRSECNARLNSIPSALKDLNNLLVKRFEKDKYIDYKTENVDTLLSKILSERRKELPFTGQVRWQDLRRFNTDPRFATSLTRNLNGQILTLAPNDSKYVYPIPQDEIDRTGIAQNER